MRAVLPNIKYSSIKSKVHLQQTSLLSNKINLNHLTKSAQYNNNVRHISINNGPFRVFPANATKQWRLVSITAVSTNLRGFKPPYEEQQKTSSDTDSKTLDAFGVPQEPSLPPEIPFLVYGFIGSLVIPILFVLVGSLLVLYIVNNQDFNEWAYRKWRKIKKWVERDAVWAGKWWGDLPDHAKVYLNLLAINVTVFGLWNLGSEKIKEFLFYNFMHSTVHKNPIGMLLSGFSHKSIMHFVFNMVALYSFCGTASFELGNSQMLGIFLTGCLISSGTSHLFKLATRDIAPSLGASGGVFALVSATTYLNPDMPLSFIFLPGYFFKAVHLLPLLVGVDVFGALLRITGRRWLGLDHAAHLGGAAFGWFYTQWVVSNLTESTRFEIARRKRDKELNELRRMYGMRQNQVDK